VLKIDHD